MHSPEVPAAVLRSSCSACAWRGAAIAAFVVVQAACGLWGYSAPVAVSMPREFNTGHPMNGALALAGVGTAAWAIASARRRWLAALIVVPVTLGAEAYLLRWEWVAYIWSTQGFAP